MEMSIPELRRLAWIALLSIGLLLGALSFLLATATGRRTLVSRTMRVVLWLSASEFLALIGLLLGFGVAVFIRSDNLGVQNFLQRPEAQDFLVAWLSFWTPVVLLHVVLTGLYWLASAYFFPTIEKQWSEIVPVLFFFCLLLFPIVVGIVTNFLSYTGMLNWYASTLDYLINLIVVSLAVGTVLLVPRLSIAALHPGTFTNR